VHSCRPRSLVNHLDTIVSSLLQLTLTCKKLEKIHWLVKPDWYHISSGGQRKRALEFENFTHRLDHQRPAWYFDMQAPASKVVEEVQERWRNSLYVRSTAEPKVELGINDPIPRSESLVEDYTEAGLASQAVIMRGTVSCRYSRPIPVRRTILLVHMFQDTKELLVLRLN
jgi:hypothetical protein